jgi:internalin A
MTLRAITTEITDCPRLFTLTAREPSAIDRLKPGHKHYHLVLWCEHPGHWHPWSPATYDIAQAADWLIRVAPAATIIFKILQLAAPVASAAVGLALTTGQMQDAQNEIQLATALIGALPTTSIQPAPEPGTAQRGSQLTPAQGQAWRAARELIFEHDPARAFGDLRRVQASSGEFLWICPQHYSDYNPGLPIIPNRK